MSRITLACWVLLGTAAAQNCLGAPILTVDALGPTPGGNRLWIARVAPDSALLPGSLAVELAFAVDDADLVAVDVNSGVWDTGLPGNNPFTGTVTTGLWVDTVGNRTFGSFGSIVLSSAAPVDLFLFETSGLGATTIRYGTAASGSATQGARIAQGGRNFDNYTGSVTAVPEPASFWIALAGIALVFGSRRWRVRTTMASRSSKAAAPA